MRCARHLLPKLVSLACLICAAASAQNIYTVVGLPYSHRAGIDGQQALNAPLDGVYGLLFGKLTGRLLFHDGGLVERLESNGTLLAMRRDPQSGRSVSPLLSGNRLGWWSRADSARWACRFNCWRPPREANRGPVALLKHG